MMLEGKDRIILAHSFAVVAHLNQPLSPRKDTYVNGPASGIDGIFQQLLHYRRRTLDNFAGSDFVGQNFRQYPNFVHIDEAVNRRVALARDLR